MPPEEDEHGEPFQNPPRYPKHSIQRLYILVKYKRWQQEKYLLQNNDTEHKKRGMMIWYRRLLDRWFTSLPGNWR